MDIKSGMANLAVDDIPTVFTQSELLAAMKTYLPKIIVHTSFSKEFIQEQSGMCLRKSSLRNILDLLVEGKFLERVPLGRFKLAHVNVDQPEEEYDPDLFPKDLIEDRMFTYLMNCFADQDGPEWSESVMQDWEGMCLRKRVIVECMDELVNSGRISRVGRWMYKLMN